MQIYSYSRSVSEFLGELTAKLDPVGGNPLIPAYATATPPPTAGEYQVAIFSDDTWSLQEDHRGRIVWLVADASQVEIIEVGAMPDEVTLLSPEGLIHPVWNVDIWGEDFTAHQVAKKREIKLAYQDAEDTSTITVGGFTYYSDYDHLNAIYLERTLAGENGETSMIVFDVDITPHDVPLTAVDGVMQDIRTNTKANYAKAKTLTREVNQATTVEEIDEINW